MSDDYKSLEHTIRNIQSKVEETTSENKSLEHTIRNIREGFISVGKKTSKFSEITNGKVYGDRTQPITQHAVQPKQPAGNEAIEKAKEAITSHDWAGDIKSSLEKIAKDKEQFAKNGKKISIHREESSFADRTTKPIDEKKKKVAEEEPKLHSEMNVNVSGKGQFQGGEFASAPARSHPGHITPHGHSDKAEIAGAYRKAKKEKLGLNRVAEETQQLDEIVPALAAAAPYVGPALAAGAAGVGAWLARKPIENMLKAGQKGIEKVSGKIDSVISPPPEELERAQKAIQGSKFAPTAPETKPKEKPVEVPVPAAPGVKPGAKPVDIPVAPEVKPGVAIPAAEPKVGAPAIPAATTPKTAVDTAVTPKAATDAAVTPKVATDVATDTATKSSESKPGFPIPIPGGSGLSSTTYHKGHLEKLPQSVGHAKKHRIHGPVKEETDGGVERKKIQNVPRPDAGDRNKIAFVGRKDDDPKTAKEKTSRQASYKVNVIDEGKKLAGIIKGVVKDTKERREDGLNGRTVVYPQVIINPNLKYNTMDTESDTLPNDKK